MLEGAARKILPSGAHSAGASSSGCGGQDSRPYCRCKQSRSGCQCQLAQDKLRLIALASRNAPPDRRRIQAAHRTLPGHLEEPKLKGALRNSTGCLSRGPAFRRALVLLKNANLAAKRSRIEIRRSATTSSCLTLRLLAGPSSGSQFTFRASSSTGRLPAAIEGGGRIPAG